MFLPVTPHEVRAGCVAVFLASVFAHDCAAGEPAVPLHQRIDATVQKHQLGKTSLTDDLTFLRRVTLDVSGRIPTVSEARAFVAETSETKRSDVVDRLLNNDEFSRHWATTLDVTLMERRGGKHVKTDEFRAWLGEALKANKPLNQLCAELVAADGSPEKQRPASAFFLERAAEPNLMARDVGRVFFGMDLQCAQCHDHPLIADYHQSDYYGLFAFVNRTTVFQPNAKQPALLAEMAGGFSEFKSVFTKRESVTQSRLPNTAEIPDPFFEPGLEYVVAPAKNVRHVPRYSRRGQLAKMIGSGDNELFRRNIANRIWAIMFGRGIVHPVDLHHSENPPSNPELLDLISTEFAAMNFSLRDFVREIALSQPYQSSLKEFDPIAVANRIDEQRQLITQDKAPLDTASDPLSERVDATIEKVDAVVAQLTPLRSAWEKTQKVARDLANKHRVSLQSSESKQAQFTANASVSDLVKQTEASIRSAAEILKDAELTKIADQFKNRLARLNADSSKLTTEVTKLQATVTAEKTKLDAAARVAIADYDKLKPLVAKLLTARAEVVAARGKLYANETRSQFLNQRGEELARLMELVEHPTKIQGAKEDVAALKEALSKKAALLEEQTTQADMAREVLKALAVSMNKEEAHRASLAKSEKLLRQSLRFLLESRNHLKPSQGDKQLVSIATEIAAISNTLEAQAGDIAGQAKAAQDRVTNSLESISRHELIVERAEAKRVAQQSDVDATRKRIADATKIIASLEARAKDHVDKLSQSASVRLEQPVLQALTPEQFCWSALHATGQSDRQFVAARAQMDKKTPLTPEELKDPTKVKQREQDARAAAMKSLNAIVARFVKLFAAQPGQPQADFFATVDQALYTSNGGELRSWLNPSGGNLADRLMQTENVQAFAEELYLAIFTRSPEAGEVKDIEEYLATSKDKRQATQEIVWAMLTSVEFRFQQ